MRRLRLVNINDEVVQALDEGADCFASQYHARLGEAAELAREAARQTMMMLSAVPRAAVFGGYLAVDEDTSAMIGTCGFRSGPTPDGVVEIAYYTFPLFEGRGYATAMADALVSIAMSSPAVRRVIAHTLPERNASTRVLEKTGMQFVGEVIDPEDGRVWQWEQAREA